MTAPLPRRTGRPAADAAARLPDLILDVATAQFLRAGYAATSIEAIAAAARVGKRTLYARWPGKPALFGAVIQRLIAGWLPPFDAELEAAAGLRDALTRAAERMLAVALTPEALALHRLLIAECGRFPTLTALVADAGADIGVVRIAGLLGRAVAAGELPAIDAGFAAEQFQHLVLTGPLHRALGFGMPLNGAGLRDWAARCVALFLDGLRGDPVAPPATH